MTNSIEEVLSKLQKAQDALNAQDLSQIPDAQLLVLEKSKSAVYREIQSLEAKQIADRDADYTVMTTGFRDCRSNLEDLSKWVAARESRDRAAFYLLSKGVSIALSLLV